MSRPVESAPRDALAPATAASAGRAIARLARQLDKALAPIDLSLAQYRLLAMLGSGTSASSALATGLSVSPPSVTAVVDGLVARGLVKREADLDDRRRLAVRLTRSGHRMLAAAESAVDARLAEIAALLDEPGNAADFISALQAWNVALDRFRRQKHQPRRRR